MNAFINSGSSPPILPPRFDMMNNSLTQNNPRPSRPSTTLFTRPPPRSLSTRCSVADVVILDRLPILQLLSAEYDPLLLRGDALLLGNLCFDLLN